MVRRGMLSQQQTTFGKRSWAVLDTNALARARLQLEAPLSDDADLSKLNEEASVYIDESRKLDGVVSFEWETIARDFFSHVARKKQRGPTQ